MKELEKLHGFNWKPVILAISAAVPGYNTP